MLNKTIFPKTRNIHRPCHIYLDNTVYFITSRIIDQQKLFNTDSKKALLFKKIAEAKKKYEIKINAFVIVDNHYHLLVKSKNGKHIPNFIGAINGKSSFELNNLENKRGRSIWDQYWDYCPRDDRDFWTHFNYIHNNPVKHGLCKNLEQAFKYSFSSARHWCKIKGDEWMYQCFSDYPIIDFSVNE